MKLATFISDHREEILETWQADALVRLREAHRVAPLRDHLGELLEAISQDLQDATRGAPAPGQTAHSRLTWANVEALAAKHGAGRAYEGLTLREVVPEFPALRSCIERLWRKTLTAAALDDIQDLMRFDEAMDLALRYSVSEFMDRLDRSRETFLGILSHDLRNPLSTIIMAAKLMRDEDLDRVKSREMSERIVSTAERVHQLVVDLLDFTRTRMSGQMPIRPRDVDLGAVVTHIAEEFTTGHPDRTLHVHVDGDLHGRWDDRRMSQAVGNLLANAFQHGAPDRPIELWAAARDSEIEIAVHNDGPDIPEVEREQLFEPLTAASDKRNPRGVGLGLFITKAIVAGHGGRISVESAPDRGTTFTLHFRKGGAPPTVGNDQEKVD